MGTVDLEYLKQGFASLVQQAEHTTLPTFILWLDLKVAEFKVNGYMKLDDSLASGENWIEFIQRWRSHSLGGYAGYQYFYPSFHTNHGQQGGQAPASGGPGPENIQRCSDPSPLRPTVPETPQAVVQIKPEPDFDRLQSDMRHERPQHSMYNDSGQRRPSFEYPVIADNIQAMDIGRRDRLAALPVEYGPVERNTLRQNHDTHDQAPPDFLQNNDPKYKDTTPERPLGGMNMEPERDALQTTVSGFFKTTTSSGVPLVSRQTANRCPVCNRIFHYYSSFNRHMKLHQGVFTHICEVCRRKFTRKEHFVRHKCHRRPNKPSRMADLNEADTSFGGAGDPLVQPPPSSNEPSPREVSIPPPLIHISQMADSNTSSSERNAFTYEQQPPYPETSVLPGTGHAPMEMNFSPAVSERLPPYPVETSTNNNKHRRKTTTPMKVENFMEPLPSIDTPSETPTHRSPVDIPEVFEKHPMDYGERPMTYYRRASSSDLGKSSTSASEFNISRPQSRNSEPARSSHYTSFDQPLDALSMNHPNDPEEKPPSGKSTPSPPSGGGLREDQYPVLKRKVLEAVGSLSQLDSSNNNHMGVEEDGVLLRGGYHHPAGQQDGGGMDDPVVGDGFPVYPGDEGTETRPRDLSATGTPPEQSSPSGPDTASTLAPACAAPTTPASDATPSSATAMSPYGSQSGEGPLGDLQYEQHISPPGSQRENPLSLNMSLTLPSAYATSEPSSPAARQQGDIHCQSCNKRFLHLSSLNRHMKLHKGVFSHACAVCSRKFTRKEHFVNHKCSRRPRNPSRVLDLEPDSANYGMPQKVEFPPSMTLPKHPSPPSAATWNAGALGISSGGMGMSPLPVSGVSGPATPQPGGPTGGGGGGGSPIPSPSLPSPGVTSPGVASPQSPEQRPLSWKWKSKWK